MSGVATPADVKGGPVRLKQNARLPRGGSTTIEELRGFTLGR